MAEYEDALAENWEDLLDEEEEEKETSERKPKEKKVKEEEPEKVTHVEGSADAVAAAARMREELHSYAAGRDLFNTSEIPTGNRLSDLQLNNSEEAEVYANRFAEKVGEFHQSKQYHTAIGGIVGGVAQALPVESLWRIHGIAADLLKKKEQEKKAREDEKAKEKEKKKEEPKKKSKYAEKDAEAEKNKEELQKNRGFGAGLGKEQDAARPDDDFM